MNYLLVSLKYLSYAWKLLSLRFNRFPCRVYWVYTGFKLTLDYGYFLIKISKSWYVYVQVKLLNYLPYLLIISHWINCIKKDSEVAIVLHCIDCKYHSSFEIWAEIWSVVYSWCSGFLRLCMAKMQSKTENYLQIYVHTSQAKNVHYINTETTQDIKHKT